MEFETINGQCFTANVYPPQEEDHAYYTSPSPDNAYIATVYANGIIRIFDSSMTSVARQGPGVPYNDLPCTCVKWFPEKQEDGSYLLVSVSTAGGVFGWSWDGTHLNRTYKVDEANNEVVTVDISPDGKQFATAGSDRNVRIYNAAFECTATLTKGICEEGNDRTTHTSRIFSVRYITKTLLVSAGWGSPVQLWDLRTGYSRVEVPGAQPGSDCVEPVPGTSLILLTAAREEKQLMMVSGVTGDEMSVESEQLCSHIEGVRLLVSRVNASDSEVWCITGAPHRILVLSIVTGAVVEDIPISSTPLNLSLGKDGTAYISCQSGGIIVVKKGM